MSEAKQSLGRVVFEIKMNILIEKSDEAIKNKIKKLTFLKNYFNEFLLWL
jgi:hypothetical protein